MHSHDTLKKVTFANKLLILTLRTIVRKRLHSKTRLETLQSLKCEFHCLVETHLDAWSGFMECADAFFS